MSQNVERAKAIKLARKLMETNGRSQSELDFQTNKLNDLMTTFNLSLNEVILATLDYKQVTCEGVTIKGDPMSDIIYYIARFTDTKRWYETRGSKIVHVKGSYYKRSTTRCVNTLVPLYHFFGLAEDAEMAEYLFNVIKETLIAETKRYQASDEYNRINIRGQKKSALVSFRKGFISSLGSRMYELRSKQDRELRAASTAAGETDIVFLKEGARESKFAEQVGISLTTRRSSYYGGGRGHSGGYSNGSSAASKVNLSRPVTGKRSGQLLLA